jgi:hypothetical protein
MNVRGDEKAVRMQCKAFVGWGKPHVILLPADHRARGGHGARPFQTVFLDGAGDGRLGPSLHDFQRATDQTSAVIHDAQTHAEVWLKIVGKPMTIIVNG